MNENQATKVVIPCRFSYVHVWEPTAIADGGDRKYSVSCLIPKTDKATMDKIKKAINAAYMAGIAIKFKGKKPTSWKNPLRDGDDRDDDIYAGHVYVNASCKTRPGVVGADRMPITDQDEFYSGCYGYVSINFYAFNTNGNMGVAAGLNNVMKVKDGDALGGRSSAESDFADIDTDTDDIPLGAPVTDDPIF